MLLVNSFLLLFSLLTFFCPASPFLLLLFLLTFFLSYRSFPFTPIFVNLIFCPASPFLLLLFLFTFFSVLQVIPFYSYFCLPFFLSCKSFPFTPIFVYLFSILHVISHLLLFLFTFFCPTSPFLLILILLNFFLSYKLFPCFCPYFAFKSCAPRTFLFAFTFWPTSTSHVLADINPLILLLKGAKTLTYFLLFFGIAITSKF